MIKMIKEEVEKMKEKTGFRTGWILKQLGIGRATYHRWLNWKEPLKKGFVHPLKPLKSEEEAVIGYAKGHHGVVYKKMTYQMIDEAVAALTPSQVYRILNKENLLDRWGKTMEEAGKEYKDKPTKPNEHWHTDIMYIKVLEMWCFMIAILDGYSRYVVGFKIMLDMTAQSVSLFMQEVIDRTGIKSVKLINDNGSQLISKDFREVLLSAEIRQIRIRRNHPQSNGKVERFNGLVRQECLRPHSPVTVTEVERVVGQYIDEYNNHRLHSAIDYMRPVDYYKGNPEYIKRQRDMKLAIAKERRLAANREVNRVLKLVPAGFKQELGQTTSYFKPAFCSI